jgi:hypothetical protein
VRVHRSTVRNGVADLSTVAVEKPGRLNIAGLSEILSSWFDVFGDHPETLRREHLEAVGWLTNQVWDAVRRSRPLSHPMSQSLHVLICFLRGVVVDLAINRNPIDDLCDLDFRQWLIGHGCDPVVAQDSDVVRAFYDTVMQYEDGEASRPSMAASAAIIVWLRMMCTTKGAMMWQLQAPMGEAVIAPIYRVLVRNGVVFKFFRKVDHLELTADKRRVRKIHLSRQVNLERGGEYRPTFSMGGLTCWPADPLWEQIVDGAAIAARKINFESDLCGWPIAAREHLQLDRDFHEVVLAIPLGAFKKLDDRARPGDELARNNPAFYAMTANIGLIPTQAMQIWCDADQAELGTASVKRAAVGGPKPFSIWADMSHLLPLEPWISDPRKPRSLYYFCGVYPRSSDGASSENTIVGGPSARVKRSGIAWLKDNATSFAPKAVGPDGLFNWKVLHAPGHAVGTARFGAQYWRANIDPGECCPGSAAGATRYRLSADNSGFDNLFLAGCWVNSGLPTSCIESAVMAGMQAARAISGCSYEVLGEELIFKR